MKEYEEMTMVEPFTKEEKNEHSYDFRTGNPAVYCSTYRKYNNGSLQGMWVDLSTFHDEEDLFEFLYRLHCDEDEPEFMFQDFENFPRKFYSESAGKELFQGLYEWINLDDEQREIVGEYWDEYDSSADIQDILDRHEYSGDDEEKFFDVLAEEFMESHRCLEAMQCYFDYKKWYKECGYCYIVTENHVFSAA